MLNFFAFVHLARSRRRLLSFYQLPLSSCLSLLSVQRDPHQPFLGSAQSQAATHTPWAKQPHSACTISGTGSCHLHLPPLPFRIQNAVLEVSVVRGLHQCCHWKQPIKNRQLLYRYVNRWSFYMLVEFKTWQILTRVKSLLLVLHFSNKPMQRSGKQWSTMPTPGIPQCRSTTFSS